jgi:hypothetical protein
MKIYVDITLESIKVFFATFCDSWFFLSCVILDEDWFDAPNPVDDSQQISMSDNTSFPGRRVSMRKPEMRYNHLNINYMNYSKNTSILES